MKKARYLKARSEESGLSPAGPERDAHLWG